jgi:hypothetical protein
LNPRPKARRRGTLHAYPLLLSRAQREEAAKNRRVTSSGESRPPPPEHQRGTSLFNGVRPPTTRRGQGERHSLIKLRERTDCPQLTDVPSDLRVNGARHASRNLMPPSKPISPPQAECACLAEAFGGGGSRTGRSSDTSLYFTRFIRVAGLQSETRPTSPEARN